MKAPAPLRALLLAAGLGGMSMLTVIGISGSIEPLQDTAREHVVCPLVGDARGCPAAEPETLQPPSDPEPCEDLQTVRSELERVFAAIHEQQAERLGAIALPDDPEVIELGVHEDREQFVGILAAYIENDCD